MAGKLMETFNWSKLFQTLAAIAFVLGGYTAGAERLAAENSGRTQAVSAVGAELAPLVRAALQAELVPLRRTLATMMARLDLIEGRLLALEGQSTAVTTTDDEDSLAADAGCPPPLVRDPRDGMCRPCRSPAVWTPQGCARRGP
jgi:hypothetical protein